jgi:hypothetical protein
MLGSIDYDLKLILNLPVNASLAGMRRLSRGPDVYTLV